MSFESSRVILPEPPDELKQLSEELRDRIRCSIRAQGPMRFSRYMEMALYEPGLGYYSAGLQKFGAGGDFITAPELGNVFARCLATQIEQIAHELDDYCIVEVGAGSGRLAAELLAALAGTAPPHRYLILEPSADLRAVQRETLQQEQPEWIDRVQWLDEPPTAKWQGVLIANEVLDALPVERFCIASGVVQQIEVSLNGENLCWSHGIASEALQSAVTRALGTRLKELTEGYTSEISLMMTPWLRGLCAGLDRGCALFIDYGYPRHEFYSAERNMGTLICHYRHRAHNEPFIFPGLQDISAFVDFTALAEAAGACGLECAGYTSQAMFLLSCGLDSIAAGLEGLAGRERLERASEIRQLTLPGAMGEKFQVMALSRGIDVDLRGFELLDLRHRL